MKQIFTWLWSFAAYDQSYLFLKSTFYLSFIQQKGSLESYFGKNVLSLEQKLKIIHGIATGLQHLANNQIVHRDLAARNILLNHAMQPKIRYVVSPCSSIARAIY